jgi:hypothetical protein
VLVLQQGMEINIMETFKNQIMWGCSHTQPHIKHHKSIAEKEQNTNRKKCRCRSLIISIKEVLPQGANSSSNGSECESRPRGGQI